MFRKTLIENMMERCVQINKHTKKIILFPEIDDKILHAASILIKKKICHPIVLGEKSKIHAELHRLKIRNFEEENIYDYLANKEELEKFNKDYIMLNKTKQITPEESKNRVSQPHFYAAMMVNKGMADGMISGLHSETKPYHPAFEIIRTREGISRASGLFLMMKGRDVRLFADCALNINPTAEQLAEIALTSAETAISFGIKPKIAMLSFSTHGSAKHEMVDKVAKATKLVHEKDKDVIMDGEIQLDAAIIPSVAEVKCPNSPLEGEANILIFPDLNAGNIGYKLVERFAGYKAIGPIMQGLNRPCNDLSRGASVQDIVDLTIITIIQAL
jgi:phosphate acetyltransferase